MQYCSLYTCIPRQEEADLGDTAVFNSSFLDWTSFLKVGFGFLNLQSHYELQLFLNEPQIEFFLHILYSIKNIN